MQLAQVNIAEMLAPIDDPIMADFVNNLDRINELAEKSDGFVWRLKGDEGNATAITVFDNLFLIINMSVWKDSESLFDFVYKTAHSDILKRKKEWFHKLPRMHMAFWYIENGHEPTPEEAKERLYYLQEHGETPYSFSFKSKFTETDAKEYIPKK
ncbi:DUF3291 domain-containing protein [Aquimarina sp. AD10]|uniref:DUF3291 domain-containing protein n=1 Tax=Aquimarina aggregata TaxID=1642818 RepID=A0A162XKD1_9FLAO|nr:MULTISPECIES: DUF3291 domain-containing protein [Aquimarina]AXT60256.1 DUF3291 domain-containing protein [Aquimarina sp. AD10]KZS38688.1 hypothetical protein AWE51_13950 [Aquimarina aggregata]RKN01309.1 DUF3291 domain-containing protein [Aquimarina sp. AD10]